MTIQIPQNPAIILPGDETIGNLFGHNIVVITSKNRIRRKDKNLGYWTVTETIGMSIINPRGLAKLGIKG
jgi:hypothetical protein